MTFTPEAVADMATWRHALHAMPETAFEEVETARYVAERLESFGIEVVRGVGGTGVVGTITNGDGPAVALRAELDALDIHEAGDRPHASRRPGKMHACGHDGHMAMLLGAARILAAEKPFRGTVRIVFQPAEENEGGARHMIEDGLFERFPVDSVFGMHNWPGLPLGHVAVRSGPIMAASDMFTITVRGQGMHAGMPHMGTDAIVAASALVVALQTIASRASHPADPVAVSVTQIRGGHALNVVPGEVVLRGTARSLMPATRNMIERRMREIAAGVAAAHCVEVAVDYDRRYPATSNHEAEAVLVAGVVGRTLGEDRLLPAELPSMGAEDFAFMLERRPGCFAWLGAGPATDGHVLHGDRYDFNDALLPIGAGLWVEIARAALQR